MMYKIEYTKRSVKDVQNLKKASPSAYKKLGKLIEDVRKHPTFGIGHPELLIGDMAGYWSRRITEKHRLVYRIEDERVMVVVVKAYGHYDDK